MWTKQNALILGALLLGCLVVFCVFVALHSSFHTCINEAAATYQAEHYENGDQAVSAVPFLYGYESCANRVARHDEGVITAIATALLTLITLGLVFLGLEQSKTTRAQLRAYILTESTGIQDQGTLPNAAIQATSGCPFYRVIIKNYGQTPAIDVRHASFIVIGQAGTDNALCVLPDDATMAAAAATIIGPSGTTTSDGSLGRPLTPFEINALAAVGQAIYVYGRIIYWDVFGRKHETTYRLGYAGVYPPHPQTTLIFTQNGNRGD